jgi:hypothetical protein
MLTQKSNLRGIQAPYDVLHWRGVKLGNGLLLLNVIEYNRTCGAEDETSSPAIEDLVRLNRRFNALDHSPGQIADLDKLLQDVKSIASPTMLWTYLRVLVKNSKPIAGNEYSTLSRPAFSIKRRVLQLSRNILRKIGEFVQSIVRRDGQQDSAFRWVVTECPGRDIRAAKLAHAEKPDVRTGADIV